MLNCVRGDWTSARGRWQAPGGDVHRALAAKLDAPPTTFFDNLDLSAKN